MKIISVNVGRPREIEWRGKQVKTSIIKQPVAGPVTLRQLNLDGDTQADLTVHGGANKAVYLYPSEHYVFWRQEYPDMELPWGMFGENLTSEGLSEDAINIGDRFRIGDAELAVTEPRMPCYKLGIRFGRPDIVKRFLASRRTGLYFRVLAEGVIRAGDRAQRLSAESHGITLAHITTLYADKEPDPDLLSRAAELPSLPESWRSYFQRQLMNLPSDND